MKNDFFSIFIDKKILIIDDEDDLKLLLRDSFEDFGAEVLIAENGKVGLSIINKSEAFDLIICDMRMPQAGGDYVLKNLASNKKPQIFIIITGFSDLPPEDLISLGATFVEAKPLNMEEFLVKISNIFQNNVG